MMTSPVSNAVYFTAYERLKYTLNTAVGPGFEPVVYFAAGGLAELFSSLLVVPMEVVKARLQLGVNPSRATGGLVAMTTNFTGVRDAFCGVYAERGFRGLTAGWHACLLQDMCFSATQFFCYEMAKAGWAARNERRHTGSGGGVTGPLTTAQTLASGAFAGAVAAFVTNPLDVITSRLMVQDHTNSYGGRSIFRVLAVTMAEAPVALWRGTLPRVAQLAPLSAVNFFVYEAVKALLVANRGEAQTQVQFSGGGGGGGGGAAGGRPGADTQLR